MDDYNKEFQIKGDGKVQLSFDSSGAVTATSSQAVTSHLGTIEAVGIENLVDVLSHEISSQYGFCTHLVKFVDGGEVEFAYNTKGEIIKCEGRKVLTQVLNGRKIIFSMKPINTEA